MKIIVKQFLTLGLLLPLAGCWDFGCCKKNNETPPIGQQATPKERCSHVGCTHDHSNDDLKSHSKDAHEHKHHEDHHEHKSHDEKKHEESIFETDEK